MLSDFQTRCHIPRPFRVLGQELRPFTLGHACTLESLGLRSVDEAGALFMAVLVCTLPPGDFQRLMGTRRLALRVGLWTTSIRAQLAWTRITRGAPAAFAIVVRALALFRQYCEHHSACPEFRQLAEESRGERSAPRGAPFLEHVRVVLQSKLGYSPAEAIALPLGRALFDYFTYWEVEGRIELLDDEAEKEVNALSEQAEALDHELTIAKAHLIHAESVWLASRDRDDAKKLEEAGDAYKELVAIRAADAANTALEALHDKRAAAAAATEPPPQEVAA